MAYGIYGSQKGCEKFTLSSKMELVPLCPARREKSLGGLDVRLGLRDHSGRLKPIGNLWLLSFTLLLLSILEDIDSDHRTFLSDPYDAHASCNLRQRSNSTGPVQGAIYPAVQTGASGL